MDHSSSVSRRHVLGAGAIAGASGLVVGAATPASAHVSSSAVLNFAPLAEGQDASAALQAAMEEAAATGQILQLEAGQFPVSGLHCPDGLVMRGVPGHTALRLNGSSSLLKAKRLQFLSLNSIVFDGGLLPLDDADGLLDLRGVDHLRLDHCQITQSAKSGLYLENCGGRIENNRITKIESAGLLSFNAEALTLSGNTVSECGDGGILVYRWEVGEDGTQIFGNRVSQISAKSGGTGQNGNGINVFRGANITITDNKISDCAFSAIRANAASNVQIMGNNCQRSGEVAVFVEFGFQGAVVSNNLIENAASGISITNFNEGGRLAVCANNLLRDITGPGPYEEPLAELGVGIAAEADTTVTGNTVESASRYGLVLGWGPYMRNLIASQNLVRHAPVGIAASVAEGARSALISQNILDGCQTNIAGFAWDEQVTEDLVIVPEKPSEHLQITGNLVSRG